MRKAAELSITGNFVDAAEALRIGLVNHVVPHDELLPFTRWSLVDDIAATPRSAQALDLYRRGEGLPLPMRSPSRPSTRLGAASTPSSTAAGRATAAVATRRQPPPVTLPKISARARGSR